MHRLLKRQIKQTFGKDFDINSFDKETLQLFEKITETYSNFDEEKKFLNYTVKKNKYELKEMYSSMITNSRLAGIGEMMENITHQWKQPLSIILSLVSLLKLELKENRDLIIIEEQSKYLNNTIMDFKNFSSHSDNENSLFILEKSINETIKLFNFQAKTNLITLDVNLEKDIELQGNVGKFNQVLLVILSNSKDAFLSRNIQNRTIQIKSKTIKKNIIITISDNAGGIKKEIINKIFEPYFTTKFKDKGTGIGLSMTHNIIHKMGGKIEVGNYKDGVIFRMIFTKYLKENNNE